MITCQEVTLSKKTTVHFELLARNKPASRPQRNILIIDHDSETAEVLRSILEAQTHLSVYVAHDRPQVLALLEAKHFEMVLIDWNLRNRDSLKTILADEAMVSYAPSASDHTDSVPFPNAVNPHPIDWAQKQSTLSALIAKIGFYMNQTADFLGKHHAH